MDGSRSPQLGPGPPSSARIGPNAILQTIAVLDQHEGRITRDLVMELAGVVVPPPDAGMLPEADCRAVHAAVRTVLGDRAEDILRQSGLATAEYILRHRIPRPAQRLIRALPGYAGAWLLAAAISRHAWTFVGSGRFRIAGRWPLVFEVTGNPLAPTGVDHPACVWHAAVFERLFSTLVWPRVTVEETDCAAQGSTTCRFVLHPGGKR